MAIKGWQNVYCFYFLLGTCKSTYILQRHPTTNLIELWTLFDTKVNFLFSRWNEKIHKRELDSISRVLGQRIARWPTRLPVILQCQDKQWICNNCNTSYVDNIKILPIQRQAGTLANGCVQPSMVSQDFLSNILLNATNTCGI